MKLQSVLENFKITKLVVVMEKWVNCLNMVDREWYTCLSSYFQLFGRRRLSLDNRQMALLLIFLRKGIERILVIIGV